MTVDNDLLSYNLLIFFNDLDFALFPNPSIPSFHFQ